MATLAEASVKIRPDTSKFGTELKAGTQGPAAAAGDAAGKSFGNKMKTAIIAIAGSAIVAQLGKVVRESITASSDLAETQSKIGVIFGKNAGKIREFAAAAATGLGQSQQTALEAAASFATFGKAANLTGDNLVNFAGNMTRLSTDVASFSNADPAQVIADFGSAMRGEFDPVEKYGILINEATLKQTAFKLGLIKSTKEALTPQQRVLAVQAELIKQTSDAQGDFARTSSGLANQQRILSASWENQKAVIGTALLPVVTSFVTLLNTKLMPNLQVIWSTHGPAIIKFLTDAATKFGEWLGQLDAADVAAVFDKGKDALDKLLPALQQLKGSASTEWQDALRVGGVVMGFLADHADTLADALPYVVAGLIAYKTAQAASNVTSALSPVFTLASAFANRTLAKSNVELAAALTASTTAQRAATVSTVVGTGAENVSLLTRIRTTAATVASTVATYAMRAAVIAWTAVQWLLNAALTANPIGIVIAVIVALVAIIVVAYQKNETFRKIVQAVWAAIKTAISATVDWLVHTAWPFIKDIYDKISAGVKVTKDAIAFAWKAISTAIMTEYAFVRDKIFLPLKAFITETIPNAFKSGVDFISDAWHKLIEVTRIPVRFVIDTIINGGIIDTFNKVAGFLGISTRIGRISMPEGFAAGGRLPGPPSDKDNMWAPSPRGPVALAGGEYVVNARQTSKYLPMLEAINAGRTFAAGGLFGLLTNPIGFVKDLVQGPINLIKSKFGDNMLTSVVTGLGSKGLDMLIEKVKSLIASFAPKSGPGGAGPGFGTWPSSPGAQRGDSGVWRSIVALINSTGPLSGSFGNGYRPGDPLWHGSGRAVDWMGYNQDALASFFFNQRSRVLELIHRTGSRDYAVTRGQDRGSFNNTLMEQHRNHIHIAMARGGRFASFDEGGPWPTGTLGFNTSGRTEHVLSGDASDAIVARLDALIGAVTRVAPGVAGALTGATGSARVLARTR